MALENPVPVSLARIERLGRNQGRYLGETIDIQATLDELRTLAMKRGWRHDCFLRSERVCLEAYHRPAAPPQPGDNSAGPVKRLYISSGIHGDEPAGPLAALELIGADQWPESVEVWLCPCLNPSGFPLNSRESACGLDLNRQYREPVAEETRAHVAWLEQRPRFDVTLCLHEDWESHGFYVYELNPGRRPSLAEAIVRRVEKVCPIDCSPLIEGREAHGGIIRPAVDVMARPDWPEAFYLIAHKTPVSYTLEAPSDFNLRTRVTALAEGVRAVLDELSAECTRRHDP